MSQISRSRSTMIPLRAVEDIEPLVRRSHEVPVFVFKHSLTCPISSAAFSRFQDFVEARGEDAEFALVEVQNARAVSSALAEHTGIRHESPQAILLRDGAVAWHASHGSIREPDLSEALDGGADAQGARP